MVAQVAAADLILTTIGRVAIRPLAGYLAKNGGKKFAQQYGPKAYTALLGTALGTKAYKETEEYFSDYIKNIDEGNDVPQGSMPGVDRMDQMDAMMAVPNTNPDIYKNDSGEDTGSNIENQDSNLPLNEPPKKEPPKGPNLGTELATEAATQATKKLLDNKKPTINKQTKDLVPEKPKFGKLTKIEKQTALALKGDKPDFYSRAVEAIKNAKQDKSTKGKWKSIIESNSTKTEMEYLGLTDILKGNESITKKELLDIVSTRDISSGITVKTIPKSQMNPLYGDYSLGYEKKGTQEHIVFQIGVGDSTVGEMYKEPHFGITYGTNTFAHARTQVGYGDPKKIAEEIQDRTSEAEESGASYSDTIDLQLLNLAKKLKNTSVVDEIQSQMLQTGAKKGFVSDYEIVPGEKLLDYLKNTGIEYRLSGKGSVMDIELQSTPGVWEDNPGSDPYSKTMDYIFRKSDKGMAFIYDPENEPNYSTPEEFLTNAYGIIPDFPIKESKKWVELVMRKLIDKAIKEGRDSIAFTNGQIQYNRYPDMEEDKRQGLKKFYKRVIYDQANKFAKEYNFELENLTIPDRKSPGLSDEGDYRNIRKNVRVSQDNQYVLRKITLQELWDRTKDTDIPGHAAFYSNTGKGQGGDFIEGYIINLADDAPFGTTTDSDTPNWNQVRNNEMYAWRLPSGVNPDGTMDTDGDIVWDMPIVPVKDAAENETVKTMTGLSELERDSILKQFHVGGEDSYPYGGEGLNNIDLIQYTEYLQNYKQPEGVDVGYDKDPEVLIKLQFPKQLQKDIISKPIKLSKLNKQTDRLMA